MGRHHYLLLVLLLLVLLLLELLELLLLVLQHLMGVRRHVYLDVYILELVHHNVEICFLLQILLKRRRRSIFKL